MGEGTVVLYFINMKTYCFFLNSVSTFFFFKKNAFLSEKQGDYYYLSVGSLFKSLQQPALAHAETRSPELHLGLHVTGRDPRTWAASQGAH